MRLDELTSWRAAIRNEKFGMRVDHTADAPDRIAVGMTGRASGGVNMSTLETEENSNFDGVVVGGMFQGYGATERTVFGIATEAWSMADAGCSGHLVNEVSVISQDDTSKLRRKRGLDVVFKNRRDGQRFGEVTNGVGENSYNVYANAVVITSQRRSNHGEYCGWTAAIRLGPHALDRSRDQPFTSIIDYRSCGRDANGQIPYRFVWKEDGVEYGELYNSKTGYHEIWSHIDTDKPRLHKSW